MALKKSLVLLFLGALVTCTENNTVTAHDNFNNSLASLKSYASENEMKTGHFYNDNLQKANNILVPNSLKDKTNGLHYNPKLNNMKQTFAMNNLKQNIVPSISPFAFNKFDNKWNNTKWHNTNLANLNNNLLQNNENEKDIFQNVPNNIAPSFSNQTQFNPKINENNFVQPLNNNKLNVQQPNNTFNKKSGVMAPNVNNINNPTHTIILPEIVKAHEKIAMLNNNIKPTKFGPFVGFGKPVNNINALNNNNSPVTLGNQQDDCTPYSLQQKDLINVEPDVFDGSMRSILHHAIFKELPKCDNVNEYNEYMLNVNNGIIINNIVDNVNDLIRNIPSLQNKKHVLFSLLNNVLRNHFGVKDDKLLNFMNKEQALYFVDQTISGKDSLVISNLIECLNSEQTITQFNGNEFEHLLGMLDKPDYNNNTVIAFLLYDWINNLPKIDEFYKRLKANISELGFENVSEIKKHLMLIMLMKRASELSSVITSRPNTNDSTIISEVIDVISELADVYQAIFNDHYDYAAKYVLVNKFANILYVIGSQLDNKQTIMSGAKNPMPSIVLIWHLLCNSVQSTSDMQGEQQEMCYASTFLSELINRGIIKSALNTTIGAFSEMNGQDVFVSAQTSVLNVVNLWRMFDNLINNPEEKDKVINFIQYIKDLTDPNNTHDFLNDIIVLTLSPDAKIGKLRKVVFKYLQEHGLGRENKKKITLYHNNIATVPTSNNNFSGLQGLTNKIAQQANVHINRIGWNKFFLENMEYCDRMVMLGNQLPPKLEHAREVCNIMNNVIVASSHQSKESQSYVFGDAQCRDIFNRVIEYSGIRNGVTEEMMNTISHFINNVPSPIMRVVLRDVINMMLNDTNNNFNIFHLLTVFNKYMGVINSNYETSRSIAIKAVEMTLDGYNHIPNNVRKALVASVANTYNQFALLFLHDLYNSLRTVSYNNITENTVIEAFTNIARYDSYFAQVLTNESRLYPMLIDNLTQVFTALDIGDVNAFMQEYDNNISTLLFENTLSLRLQIINGTKVHSPDDVVLCFVEKSSNAPDKLLLDAINNDVLLSKYKKFADLYTCDHYDDFVQNNIGNRYRAYKHLMNDVVVNNVQGNNWEAFAKIIYEYVRNSYVEEFDTSEFKNINTKQFLSELTRNKDILISVIANSLESCNENNDNSLLTNLCGSLYYAYCVFKVILSRPDANTKLALLSHQERDRIEEMNRLMSAVLSPDVTQIYHDNYAAYQGLSNSMQYLYTVFESYKNFMADYYDTLAYGNNLADDNRSLQSSYAIGNESGVFPQTYLSNLEQ